MTGNESIIMELWDKILGVPVSPQTGGVALAILLVAAAYRLLAAWQRRVTFDHIFDRAPGGSVIVQQKSRVGPAMWIWVGEGERPSPTQPERIYMLIQYQLVPLAPGRPGDHER